MPFYHSTRTLLLVIMWMVLSVITACSQSENRPTARSTPQTISCTTAYRISSDRTPEPEETVALIGRGEHTIEYDRLTFIMQYATNTADGENNLIIQVMAPDINSLLTQQLYQIDPAQGVNNQFVGGHGFTGLHYTYHPITGEELQYWCHA